MKLDISVAPFSRFGSFMAFSKCPDGHGRPQLYMRSVHGESAPWEVFRLELILDGKAVAFRESATATLLRLEAEGGFVEICIAEPKLLVIRCSGLALRLTKDDAGMASALPVGSDRWQVSLWRQNVQYMLRALRGELTVDDLPGDAGEGARKIVVTFRPGRDEQAAEGSIEEFLNTWQPRTERPDFDDCHDRLAKQYEAWRGQLPAVPDKYAEAAELAGYRNWSACIAGGGQLTRPGMLMSKNRMCNLWNWDNCFNAMATINMDAELAWDQFMTPFDHQAADGALPDYVNDRVEKWGVTKPPVHGWALGWMMDHSDAINVDRLNEAYQPLCKWTRWWLDCRDYDGDGLPNYNHGMDSGWDNATVFDETLPAEGPDLAAYLVCQMATLSRVAGAIGREAEAADWQKRSAQLLDKMMAHFWRDGRFTVLRSGDHLAAKNSENCLLPYMPIVLGKRLPAEVLARLAEGLGEGGNLLTEHGLASESPQSPQYDPDGYWRGPIWAPTTMIVVDGLAAAGHGRLAGEIARRFCDMCAGHGFGENFDALTGQALRDQGYAWTASVFLILAGSYLDG